MRVRVDDAKCQGHTLCALNAPQVFDLREDDGHSFVRNEVVPPEHQAAVRAAFEACPERAIVLIEE